MLKLSHVSAGYQNKNVLDDITLHIPAGENLCILGPNGCGKTTLLRVMAGLIPAQGNITLDGRDLRAMKRKEIASRMAVMSQISSVHFPYSVYETVMLGRYQHMKRSLFGTVPSKKDHAYVEQCLETTGLSSLRDKRLDELSGGQLQRVFLAHTLAQDPDIILLDEPTNHLDMKHQLELMAYLRDWSVSKKRTVIGVFHDINLALHLSEQVVFLKNGQVAGKGLAQEVINPAFLQDIYDVDIVRYMLESLEKWKLFQS